MPIWFLYVFLIPFAQALEFHGSFARHFQHSSAASADRDFGSGRSETAHLERQSSTIIASCPGHFDFNGVRIGEAMNPGPHTEQLLTVGVSNPGGLRQKEDILLSFPKGIWSMTETHLSATTKKTCSGILRRKGAEQGRIIRPLFGADAPLRAGSTWSGSWTGVACISDIPATTLDIPWPDGHWDTARVLISRHWAGSLPIVIGTFYGFTRGPTWPNAIKLSDSLLETYTREIVIGVQGVRLIQGDFNQAPGHLQQQQIWMRYGWMNLQSLAEQCLDHQHVMTCKHATEPDQIWLSPEACRLFRQIHVHENFTDHCTLSFDMVIPSANPVVYKWPLPARIPWTEVETQDWHPTCQLNPTEFADSTSFMRVWASDFETSVDDQLQRQGKSPLPSRTRGRAQRLAPDKQLEFTPMSKPSRDGEVRLQSSAVGLAVRQWFKQIRRFQSLKHSVLSGNDSINASEYRASLWSSITRAPGFSPNFKEWWRQRVPFADDVQASLLYEEFQYHFRKFEKWHLEQRKQTLKAKYQGTMKTLFHELRPDTKPSIDLIWKEVRYTILAVDQPTGRLHLGAPIQTDFDFVWYLDQHQVSVFDIDGDMCTIGATDITPGDELVQKIFVSDTNDLLKNFGEFWHQRWSLLQDISNTDWMRITNFARSFLPRHVFDLPRIDVSTWKKTVIRFKAGAARGPDGFDKEDLHFMPDGFINPLLNLLHHIETTDCAWPHQLRFGTVLGFAKQNDSHEISHFRPITLFSMLYRCWSRIRTKQMIRQMAVHMPPEALGFLPHRETTEVWLMLQAYIELMAQQMQPFCGLSTDLKKAFNHIGRKQVFHVAERLGLPSTLLNPWKKFLASFVRRFDIRGCLGDELQSSSGFPEGDPLSIISMLCVNWSYHIYMQHFCPKVQSYSFVDNLTCAAREAQLVAQAYFALRSICQLFGLATDDEKTYIWALTTAGRQSLSQLGFPCLSGANELGGAMTFGKAVRTRTLKTRGANLKTKWDKLRKSLAPTWQKMASLRLVFWPMALHGSPNCLVTHSYAHDLRKQAVKALGVSGGGSNPLLRLSLSDDMMNDPGFYQIKLALGTMKRLLWKQPDLLPMWTCWMQTYCGKFRPGPFSQLLHCLQVLAWRVTAPPFIQDHEGRIWDLMTIDDKTFTSVLEDAWLQHVAHSIQRKSMSGLTGLDGTLTRLDYARLTSLDRSRLSAIQCGAFFTAAEQAKYDETKTAFCSECRVEDDRQHWLICPRFSNIRRSIHDWFPDNVELPPFVRNHLLAPRLECAVVWRQLLWRTDDQINFCVLPPKTPSSHLFLDGSCTNLAHTELNFAAWAVVCATSGTIIAEGHLQGITQSIDRAELLALIAAMSWCVYHQTNVHIWSDSLSTVRIALQILQTGVTPHHVANLDLWLRFADLCEQTTLDAVQIHWIPSHLDALQAVDAFEDWIIGWNSHVDAHAVQTNWNRSEHFWAVHKRYEESLNWWATRLRQLRSLYFQIAEDPPQDQSTPNEVVDILSSDEDAADLDDWMDLLPVNWQSMCRNPPSPMSEAFLVQLLTWICKKHDEGGKVHVLRDLEFVFALKNDPDFHFPYLLPGTTVWQLRDQASLFQKPTISLQLRPVQTALTYLQSLFPMLPLKLPPKSSISIGLVKPFHGIRIRLADLHLQQARARLAEFTALRPVRKANDLARPG